jgi:hypothetical protein
VLQGDVHSWHRDVHQHDVGCEELGHADCVFSSRGLTHHSQAIVSRQRGANALPHDRVIVDEK